jgi:hypothetical protein
MCAQVSLVHWNQDEENGGGFGGPHCMVPAGYGAIMDALAAQLDVRLGCPVATVTDGQDGVLVVTQTGERPPPHECTVTLRLYQHTDLRQELAWMPPAADSTML